MGGNNKPEMKKRVEQLIDGTPLQFVAVVESYQREHKFVSLWRQKTSEGVAGFFYETNTATKYRAFWDAVLLPGNKTMVKVYAIDEGWSHVGPVWLALAAELARLGFFESEDEKQKTQDDSPALTEPAIEIDATIQNYGAFRIAFHEKLWPYLRDHPDRIWLQIFWPLPSSPPISKPLHKQHQGLRIDLIPTGDGQPDLRLSCDGNSPLLAAIRELSQHCEKHRLWILHEPARQAATELPTSETGQLAPTRRARKGGRPRYADDDWAWQQVNELKREKKEIYALWKERIGKRADILSDAWESFNKAVRPNRISKK